MTELATALEATALAQYLKVSRWVYPLVNASHILGIALLVGSVIPMDVAILRGRTAPRPTARLWAAAGFALTVLSGAALFITQADDYLRNPWFLAKLSVLSLALLNAALYLWQGTRHRRAALISLLLWPTVLVLGRFIGFS